MPRIPTSNSALVPLDRTVNTPSITASDRSSVPFVRAQNIAAIPSFSQPLSLPSVSGSVWRSAPELPRPDNGFIALPPEERRPASAPFSLTMAQFPPRLLPDAVIVAGSSGGSRGVPLPAQLQSISSAGTLPERRIVASIPPTLESILQRSPGARDSLLLRLDCNSYQQLKEATDRSSTVASSPLPHNPHPPKVTLSALTAFSNNTAPLSARQKHALEFFCDGGSEKLGSMINTLDYECQLTAQDGYALLSFHDIPQNVAEERYFPMFEKSPMINFKQKLDFWEKEEGGAPGRSKTFQEALRHNFTFRTHYWFIPAQERSAYTLDINIPLQASAEVYVNHFTNAERFLRHSRQPEKIAFASISSHLMQMLHTHPAEFTGLSEADKTHLLTKGQWPFLETLVKIMPEKTTYYYDN